jgi:hypothetical protein
MAEEASHQFISELKPTMSSYTGPKWLLSFLPMPSPTLSDLTPPENSRPQRSNPRTYQLHLRSARDPAMREDRLIPIVVVR